MTYCSYEAYQKAGGTLDSKTWEVWVLRASRKIDRLTHGRAEHFAPQLVDELADACTRIIDIMAGAEAARTNSIGLTSAANDGYSESYADPLTATQAAERACYAALADALGYDRYGLLYAGVM